MAFNFFCKIQNVQRVSSDQNTFFSLFAGWCQIHFIWRDQQFLSECVSQFGLTLKCSNNTRHIFSLNGFFHHKTYTAAQNQVCAKNNVVWEQQFIKLSFCIQDLSISNWCSFLLSFYLFKPENDEQYSVNTFKSRYFSPTHSRKSLLRENST